MLNIMYCIVVFATLISLSTVCDNAQASKRDARESWTPNEPYHYDIPSPFEEYQKDQKDHEYYEHE